MKLFLTHAYGAEVEAKLIFSRQFKQHTGRNPSDPETACDCSSEMASDHEPEQGALLIVPDGTWRKARKIIYANPILNTVKAQLEI